MNKLVLHFKGIRKSGYIVICSFLFVPLVYGVVHIANESFAIINFLEVLAMALATGVGVAILVIPCDYYITEKLINRLGRIEFTKVGDGNLRVIDEYTGWRRRIEIEGTYHDKRIWISHHFEKGWWGQIPYLNVYIEPFEEQVTEIMVTGKLNSELINNNIDVALSRLTKQL